MKKFLKVVGIIVAIGAVAAGGKMIYDNYYDNEVEDSVLPEGETGEVAEEVAEVETVVDEVEILDAEDSAL